MSVRLKPAKRGVGRGWVVRVVGEIQSLTSTRDPRETVGVSVRYKSGEPSYRFILSTVHLGKTLHLHNGENETFPELGDPTSTKTLTGSDSVQGIFSLDTGSLRRVEDEGLRVRDKGGL